MRNMFLCDVFLLGEHIRVQFFNITEQTVNVSDLTRIVREGFLDELLVVVQSNCLLYEESAATTGNYL